MDEKVLSAPKDWLHAEDFYTRAFGNRWYRDISILEDIVVKRTFRFFEKENIKSVCLPITTGAVTSPMGLGSDSLPVPVKINDVEMYLADSMQFHLEYMLRFLKDGVHYIMPSFRGENSDFRHLGQFYHSEAEIKGNLEDVMGLVERYIISLFDAMLSYGEKEITEIAGTVNHIKKIIEIGNNGFPRITLDEAEQILKCNPNYIETNDKGFRSITNLGEKELIKIFGGIVWLTHHDFKSVPFYQARDVTGKYTLNADLLFGIGEVVGCGERHENYLDVIKSMEELQVNPESYEWYCYMKKNYPLKSAGFGMGMERFLLFVLNQNDIRDMQIIPRLNNTICNP